MINPKDETQQSEEIASLIRKLRDPDRLKSRMSRLHLVRMGFPAVQALIPTLSDPDVRLRWEAVKALGEIGDPTAAPALVRSLEDENQDVRWTAADSLIMLGRGAIVPLLQALVDRFYSVRLRQEAHHILHVLKQRGLLTENEIEVLAALESAAPEVQTPWAAEKVLESLKIFGKQGRGDGK